MIRTRFAPSPTGYLHVGGVRTALYSYLFARRHQGEFILRIEDTDLERSTKESVDVILQGMDWLGLKSDKEVVFQSQRKERYLSLIEKLLQEGKAYRCYCSKERLAVLREKQKNNKEKPKYDGCCRDKALDDISTPHVIRFKNPLTGNVCFTDHVYGSIEVSNEELDDLIILRSDGMPTYNFSVVVDDADMEISHVIRGDDHINNTPRQINLFQALGFKVPEFAHLPMILGEDGKRLSKRHGAVNVLEFKEQGYLPEALLNYLVRLGWSMGNEEVFSRDEMIKNFSLEAINRGSASFNYDKLVWLNQHYLKQKNIEELAILLKPLFESQGVNLGNGPSLLDVIPLYLERSKTLVDLVNQTMYLYQDSVTMDEKAQQKHLKEAVLKPLSDTVNLLRDLKSWDKDILNHTVKSILDKYALKPGKFFPAIRVAVTGSASSPSIDDTLFLLGKEKVLARLSEACQWLKELSN